MAYNTCYNCRRIIPGDKFVCDSCYDMYFNKVKNYLYKNRLSNMVQINRDTHVPIKLLEDFYENGDILQVVESDINVALAEYQRYREEELARQQKIETLKQLQKAIDEDKKDNSSDGPKMRFISSFDRKTR